MSKSLSKLNLDPGKSNAIKLYHGSPNAVLTPTFGLGEDKYDYGRGFYLTPDKELAKEWAVSGRPGVDGWLYSYTLDCTGLRILNFETPEKNRALYWMAELILHREPDEVSRGANYDICRKFLLKRFGANTQNYDVVCGWRADDSYFRVVNQLLGDALSLSLLEEALRLGDLGIQYCCRSEKAFANLKVAAPPERAPYAQYSRAYHRRDTAARDAFTELQRSPRNRPRKGNLYMRDLYVAKGGH